MGSQADAPRLEDLMASASKDEADVHIVGKGDVTILLPAIEDRP